MPQSKHEAKGNESEIWLRHFKANMHYQKKKERRNKFPQGNREFCLGTWDCEVPRSISRQKYPAAAGYIWEMLAFHTGTGRHGCEVQTELNLWE